MKNLLSGLIAGFIVSLPFLSTAQTWTPYTPKPTSNVLWDVFALDANNTWAVGNSGTVIYWNGSSWTSQSLGVVSQRFGVWASSASNVYVVGITTGSQLHRFNGTSWVNETAAIGWGSGTIRSVWGSSDNDVWITGGSGRVYRYKDGSWTAQNTGIPGTFAGNRIWGTDASNIWVVGSTGGSNTGAIYKWDTGTSSWTAQATGLPAIKAVWGSSATEVWAAGGNGAAQQGKIYKLSGASWTDQSPSGTYASFYHISGSSASNIYAVGYLGLLYKYDGTSWTAQSSGLTTDINAVSTGQTGTSLRLWLAGYGDATVNPLLTASLTTLPVSWQSFEAHQTGNDVLLNWTTATEENTQAFEIQHQLGENNWRVIGTVDAAGNSNTALNYSFRHSSAPAGKNNYRIRQIDLDGRISFSKNVMVQITLPEESLQVLANPVISGRIELRSTVQQTIRITDMQGRELIRQKIGAGASSISTSQLAAGTYLLIAENGTQKFLVK